MALVVPYSEPLQPKRLERAASQPGIPAEAARYPAGLTSAMTRNRKNKPVEVFFINRRKYMYIWW
jgi:hypothetical protein